MWELHSVQGMTCSWKQVWPRQPVGRSTRFGAHSCIGWEYASNSSNITSGSSNTASGGSNITSGSSNTTSGSSNTASGGSNTAGGGSNTTSGSSNTTSGSSNTTSGSSNTAGGGSNITSGSSNTSSGGSNTASGGSNITSGSSNTTNGSSNTTSGSSNTAGGGSNTTSGGSNTASGGSNTAGGGSNTAGGGGNTTNGSSNTTSGSQGSISIYMYWTFLCGKQLHLLIISHFEHHWKRGGSGNAVTLRVCQYNSVDHTVLDKTKINGLSFASSSIDHPLYLVSDHLASGHILVFQNCHFLWCWLFLGRQHLKTLCVSSVMCNKCLWLDMNHNFFQVLFMRHFKSI